MSIKITSLVWEHSKHKDTALLLMLAIADHADDNGYAWPSIPTLQSKIRVDSPRTVHYNLKKLVGSGELVINKTKGGRSNTHGFQINVEYLKDATIVAGFTKKKGAKIVAPFRATETLQSDAQTLQSIVQNPAIAFASEPSLTVIEPSSTAKADEKLSVADATKPNAIHKPTRTDEMIVKAQVKKADDLLMAHLSRNKTEHLQHWEVTCGQIEEYASGLGKPKKVVRAISELRNLITAGVNAAGLRCVPGKDSDIIEILQADLDQKTIRQMAEQDARDFARRSPTSQTYFTNEFVQAIRIAKTTSTKPVEVYVPVFN